MPNGHSKDFWRRVQKTDGCWLWIGRKDTKGYGMLKREGRRIAAHRLAWILAHGEIPDGLHILHRCDIPACVRVDHLFIGTQRDNMRDKEAKRRGNHAVGPRNGKAYFTEEEVLAIRAEWTAGIGPSVLARKYSAPLPTINSILRRESWRHI